eukprot:6205091-Pleurochrysis_carterae.AAC.2
MYQLALRQSTLHGREIRQGVGAPTASDDAVSSGSAADLHLQYLSLREDLGDAPRAVSRARSAHQEPMCVVQKSLLPQRCRLQQATALSPTGAQLTTNWCPHQSSQTAESLCRPIRLVLRRTKSLLTPLACPNIGQPLVILQRAPRISLRGSGSSSI